MTVPAHPEAKIVARELLRYPFCLIATHVNPEGDAIGSQLALAMALEQRGINVLCYDKDGVPDNCRFMSTWERVATELPPFMPPLVIIVDADRLERCDLSPEKVHGAEKIVRIDHHMNENPPAGPALVDSRAAAAGELVYELLPHLGATLTPEIATCLLGAIMVDTGRFSYSNTTPATHRIAAELVAAGADVQTIAEWTWGRLRYPALKLRGYALASLQASPDGRYVWAVLRAEDYQAANAGPEDTDGVIDEVRLVRDSEVAVLFSERQGVVRVSLRSHQVDVAAIAQQFGGGGHLKAAGITMEPPLEAAICGVLHAVEESLKGS